MAYSTHAEAEADINAKAYRQYKVRSVTGNYTVQAADLTDEYVLEINSASAVTITMPTGLATQVPLPWRQLGAGTVTFAAGSGATRMSRGSVWNSAGQGAEGTITLLTGATQWLLSGDISA